MKSDTPLVSVCCITYNHEKYIKETLNGFLIQKTNFPIEIIIHDDASTDDTAKIIKEFADNDPRIVPVLRKTNIKSTGVPIFPITFKKVKGKYIAMCEGDDYWTDPLKLQKQVDFLENNVDYGLVHGDTHFFFQKNGIWKKNANSGCGLANKKQIPDYQEQFQLLIDGSCKIRTATVLFRSEFIRERRNINTGFSMGDTPLWLEISQKSKFKYFDEVFAVYRIHPESLTNSNDVLKTLKFRLAMVEMRIFYSNLYDFKINDSLKKRYNDSLLRYKLLNINFIPKYPLYNPSKFELFKYRYMKLSLLNYLFRMLDKTNGYLNLLINKL